MDIRFYDSTNARKKRDNIDQDFESQFSAATSVFAFFLFKGKKKENIKQINLYCKRDIDSIKYYEVIDGFWDIDVPYDPNEFLSIREDKLKRKEFRTIFGIIFQQIFKYKNWNEKELENALSSSEELSFKKEFLLKGTPKKNPAKDKIAVVRCIESIKNFQMLCTVYDKKGNQLLERIILDTLPSPFNYYSFLGSLKWDSNTEITIEAASRSWKRTINIDEITG